MKYLLVVMTVSVALVGCDNSQLMDCRLDNAELQEKVTNLQMQIDDKDRQIKELKDENIATQNKVMDSISVMMTKQSLAEDKLKYNLNTKTQELLILQPKYDSMKNEYENLKGLYQNAVKCLEDQARQNSELQKLLNEARKDPKS